MSLAPPRYSDDVLFFLIYLWWMMLFSVRALRRAVRGERPRCRAVVWSCAACSALILCCVSDPVNQPSSGRPISSLHGHRPSGEIRNVSARCTEHRLQSTYMYKSALQAVSAAARSGGVSRRLSDWQRIVAFVRRRVSLSLYRNDDPSPTKVRLRPCSTDKVRLWYVTY